MNFEQHLRLHYDELSEMEKDMARYLHQYPEQVVDMTIVELGETLLSSKSSILRLAKRLGFHGFSEMKYVIKESLNQQTFTPEDLVSHLKEEIHQTFQYSEQTNFQPILDQLKRAQTVIIYATGFTQTNYSQDFSNDLFLSGRPNYLLSGETNFAMIAETLTARDFVIVTSLTGETPGIRETLKLLEINQVPLLSVTQFGKNYLSDHANYHLYYEITPLPSHIIHGATSMIALNVILTILARKYREFVLYDE
ncbi:MAG: MurR/RpiR family transcriptional regulator [Aerococcus sp.]|nr:MurR/RpiR family transcriptional regulator [Aerococcus sp.]